MPTNRPLLLPQNRRLRHLHGLSLRNLTFTKPHGRTTDDAAINKTHGKLDTLREASQLQYSQSSENLSSAATPTSPPKPRPRRRSTNLGNANPLTRQKQLELSADTRTADVFFSLHTYHTSEPFYISETGIRATNFDFQSFELADHSPSITRSCQLVIRVWAKRQEPFFLLLEDDVDLRCLSFVNSISNIHMPPNCLVFHLVDGMYVYGIPSKIPPPKQGPSLPTTSYNSLMKLCTLENSVWDAQDAEAKLALRADQALEEASHIPVAESEDRLRLAMKLVAQQHRAVEAARKRRDELQASIRARREAIALGRQLQENALADVENATEQLSASQHIVAKTKENIHGQRRRICEDLIRIFPITDSPSGQPLSFQICGVTLPNTTYDPALAPKSSRSSFLGGGGSSAAPPSEDALSAGLGYVAQLVNALQSYLGVALPYPVSPYASRSSIRDDISMLPDPQRDFPLYVPRGGSSAQYRFDYGWFLLNKDIEVLCTSQGIRVVDIRHTLPNLRYLLYVATAGKDELPERKKGGIMGLWHGRLLSRGGFVPGTDAFSDEASSTGGSRRGSADSEAVIRQRDELRRAMKGENGRGLAGGETAPSGDDSKFNPGEPPKALQFDDQGTSLMLRTKGLRGDSTK
ncbi:hypothetical protein RB594_007007 [Gaeumannomyces avenae]